MSSLPPADTSRHFLPTTPEFVTAATTPRHAVKIIYNITDKGNPGQILATTNWGLAGVCSRENKRRNLYAKQISRKSCKVLRDFC